MTDFENELPSREAGAICRLAIVPSQLPPQHSGPSRIAHRSNQRMFGIMQGPIPPAIPSGSMCLCDLHAGFGMWHCPAKQGVIIRGLGPSNPDVISGVQQIRQIRYDILVSLGTVV